LHSRPGAPLIEFRIDPAAAGADPEAYTLIIEPKRIRVTARDRRGVFYGAMTLWQLLTADGAASGDVRLQSMRIEDAPRFRWRGVMLDSARHFQTPAESSASIDGLAIHKLNVPATGILTDDQAWRLEIRKYPRLTSVGAWRRAGGPRARRMTSIPATGKPPLYGGYYSQDTVRHLVDYAAKRASRRA